jgi:hypothetical protein
MITNWLSKRGFIVGALASIIASYPALAGVFSVEGAVSIVVSAVVSGVFWGWVLTKWAGRWFGGPKN